MSSTQPNTPHHEAKQQPLQLELKDGKMEIKPSNLDIIWGRDNRYWNVPDDGDAELFQVSWLEVRGCVSTTDPEKEYEVGFNVSLTPDAFGWSGSPVYILVKRGKTGKFNGKKSTLEGLKEKSDVKTNVGKLESKTDDADENSKIYFGLYEVWRGKWKGGLKIHHAFIKEK